MASMKVHINMEISKDMDIEVPNSMDYPYYLELQNYVKRAIQDFIDSLDREGWTIEEYEGLPL